MASVGRAVARGGAQVMGGWRRRGSNILDNCRIGPLFGTPAAPWVRNGDWGRHPLGLRPQESGNGSNMAHHQASLPSLPQDRSCSSSITQGITQDRTRHPRRMPCSLVHREPIFPLLPHAAMFSTQAGDWERRIAKEEGAKRAVLVWGNGDWGRLGLGTQESRNEPSVVWGLFKEDPVQVACGGSHTLVLTASGDVFSMGLNHNGQLGVEESSSMPFSSIPLLVTSPHTGLSGAVRSIAAGAHHSACVDSHGDVWVWGSNASWQLGIGSGERAACVPRRVEALKGARVRQVALGNEHSLACTEDGLLLTWGRGDVGHGPRPLFSRLSGRNGEPLPRLVQSLNTEDNKVSIESVAAGMLHSAALTSQGQLLMFGGNSFSQLGVGDQTDRGTPTELQLPVRVESVACGGYHTLAVTSRGDVAAWGANEAGCLGFGREHQSPAVIPLVVGGMLSKEFVSQVACGWKHSAAIAGSKLYTWGWGGSMGSYTTESLSSGGQLGLGNEFDYFEPTPVVLEAAFQELVVGPSEDPRPDEALESFRDGKLFMPEGSEESIQVEQVSCGFNHTAAIVSFNENDNENLMGSG